MRRNRALLISRNAILAGSLFCSTLNAGDLSAESQVAWSKFGDDLQIAQIPSQPAPIGSNSMTFIRSSLSRYRVAVIRAAQFEWQRASAKALCKASRALACINANFFDESGAPLGLVISAGRMEHNLHRGGNTLTGLFLLTRKGMAIINRSDFDSGAVLEAVQAGPRLISRGAPMGGLSDVRSSRRSGLCIDKEQRLVLFASSSGLGGISIAELQSLLLNPQINCVDALNLDGGGSAQLYLSNSAPGAAEGTQEINVSGHDDIPVALSLMLNSP
jgi:exopolysaccharide biosynthesis protein